MKKIYLVAILFLLQIISAQASQLKENYKPKNPLLNETSLHSASFCLEDNLVLSLLSFGVNPNEQNAFGMTALHIIALRQNCYFKEKKRITNLLLQSGALLDVESNRYGRPIDCFLQQASFSEGLVLLEKVLQYNNTLSNEKKVYIQFEDICKNYSDDVFELLYKYNVIKSVDQSNKDLIFTVVNKRKVKVLSYMIKNGFDCNVREKKEGHYRKKEERSLVHIACQNGDYRILKKILKNIIDLCESSLFTEKLVVVSYDFDRYSILEYIKQRGWNDLLTMIYDVFPELI